MAGGKETPRQKMIGLMYLVLTALLALNVDSAVLDRFIQINQALKAQVDKYRADNMATVQTIAKQVEERGNKEEEIAIFKTAEEVRNETAAIINYIENLKEQLIIGTGGYEDSLAGTIAGAKDTDYIANMMIVKKRGDTLQTKLNEYAQYLADLTGDTTTFKAFALDGEEDPYYSQLPVQRTKDFSELLFESSPAAAGLATFSQLQSKVMDYETEAMSFLAGQVGAQDIRFDNIKPLVRPESKYVAAGTMYKAEMFAAAAASNITPVMSTDVTSVSVDNNGVGTFEFKASGGNYDADGRIKKSFTAKIVINDKEYIDEVEYFVVKPAVQIQSASVQALYLNCGNELFVNVPALGQAYNPSFKAEGGQSFQGSEKGKVTLVPTGRTLTLSVYSDGTLIDNVEFNVRSVPKPDIVMKADGGDVDEKKGMSGPPRELSMLAIPDDDFRNFLPKDARYRVSEWEAIWARGSRAIDRQEISGPTFRVPASWRQMRPGDRIVIEVTGVQRMNFRDKVENVVIGVGQRVKQIPIN